MEKLTAKDPATHSADLIAENIERLRALFPEAWEDGKVDFDVLRQLLGGLVDEHEEKYGLNWYGKRRARQIALTPSTGTLRPCPDESIDWDATKNLVIEGENLEVLKLLQKSYSGKVKLIYIDPPYNTGKDFVYPDDYRNNIRNYLQITGQVEDGGRPMSSNPETSGRFHTDWLSMMYPRLKLARYLLKQDGIICVSIDDNEEAALRYLLDDIFGENNRLSTLIWHLGTGPTAGHFLRSHETILCYARDKSSVPNFRWRGGGDVTASALKRISAANPASDIRFPPGIEIDGGGDHDFPDELGGAITQTVVEGSLRFRAGRLVAPVTLRAGWAMKTQIESWLRGEETYDTQGQRVIRLYFSRTGMLMYQKERTVLRPRTVLLDVASTADGSIDLEACGIPRYVFDFPKPVSLVRTLVGWITDPQSSDLVVDFFAGSGTTGHAVLEQNSLDGGNRSYLCVQLPEPLPKAVELESHEQLNTIADALKYRLRRAAGALASENSLGRLDVGLRVFKLASSNIRAWEPDRENLQQTLLDSVQHLEEGRNEDDVLFELLLKLGLDLCVPIEKKRIAGKAVSSVGGGVLIACLAERINGDQVEPLAEGIIEWRKALAPAGNTTCVFRDSAFPDDVAKTNLAAILQQYGLTNVHSL